CWRLVGSSDSNVPTPPPGPPVDEPPPPPAPAPVGVACQPPPLQAVNVDITIQTARDRSQFLKSDMSASEADFVLCSLHAGGGPRFSRVNRRLRWHSGTPRDGCARRWNIHAVAEAEPLTTVAEP